MGDNTKYGPGREFVRAQPETVPSAEVAKLATEAGIPMTLKQATQWRYLIKREKLQKAKGNMKTSIKRKASAPLAVLGAEIPKPAFTIGSRGGIPGHMPTNSKEAQLRLLIFELGYDTVALCLEEYRRWVKS